jgi:Rrf2 family iron-sulfur cluster assembly transcriptional regulator
MKITAQEEYGLRILLRIGRCLNQEGMSIPQLSEAEGLSNAYVAKLTRILRQQGFIKSTPGYKGGYLLAVPPKEININKVLKALGGALFSDEFCGTHSGISKICTNSVECSARSLWQMIQFTMDRLLDQITLFDLTASETQSGKILEQIVDEYINKIRRKSVVVEIP